VASFFAHKSGAKIDAMPFATTKLAHKTGIIPFITDSQDKAKHNLFLKTYILKNTLQNNCSVLLSFM